MEPSRFRRLLATALVAAALVAVALTVANDRWGDDGDGEQPVEQGVDQDDGDTDVGTGTDDATSDGADTGDRTAHGSLVGRSLDEIPDEFPAAIVTEDARGLEGRRVSSGKDWSVSVTYTSGWPQDDLEATVDAAAEESFERRNARFDADRKVIVYDRRDGAVMTVTLMDHGDEIAVAAILTGP